jgi:alkylhydroperoxidase family enzyme
MRIAPLTEPYEPGVGELLASMMPPGVPPIALFRTFARNPGMADAMRGWGRYELSARLSASLRLREIVIDRTTARCGCEYEWGVHVAFFAEKAGFTADQVASLTAGRADDPCWDDPQDRLAIRLADALHDTSTVDDALWAELAAAFTEPQLLDLTMLAGWYHAISYTARAAAVPNEPGAPTFADVTRPSGR